MALPNLKSGGMSHELRVHGMSCGACVQRVEAALRTAAGVRSATVNLMTESATVTCDGGLALEPLINAVRAAGYDAERMPSSPAEAEGADDAARTEAMRRSRQAVVQAIGLTAPILVLDHFGHALQAGHAAGEIGWRILQGGLMVMLLASAAGGPILIGGLRAIRHGTSNMDVLISLGVLAAFGSSVYGSLTLRSDFVHYHAAAVNVLLVAVGRHLEAMARGRAMSAIAALARRSPATASVRRGGDFAEIPVADVALGDQVRLVPHAAVPVDGEVAEGVVTLDESLLTGEPSPVVRRAGDVVRAGTLVVEGTATFRATRVGRESTVGRIVDLVRRAQASRTEMQRLADYVAGIFTPIVIAISLLTLCGWLWVEGRGHTSDAIRAAIAVMVAACPCAMGLATPTAVLVASGQAALRGILVRDAATLEAMGRIDTVVWDKTGTLTQGRPMVRRTVPHGEAAAAAGDAADSGDTSNQILRMAASAEQFSPHPLAKALVAEARRRGLTLIEPDGFESTPGEGVRATVDGHRVAVGRLEFVAPGAAERAPDSEPCPASGEVAMTTWVSVDGRLAATIGFDDPIRPSAADAVRRLRRLRIESHMLTGDSAAAARLVATQVGIDWTRASAGPQDKVDYVMQQRGAGRRVAVVGDGVNDAAALAAADVGIAFATGADVAVAAAGINLIGSTPHLVADAVELARASVRIIRQNLFWAFFYNALILPAAALGHVPPGWAAGAMMLSSLTVVLNALRLRIPRVRQPSTFQDPSMI